MYRYRFTVFTPTYNRAHLLHRVFNSLQDQTFTDFEWLIIDDGSTDNTLEIVNKFIKKANFPISYVKKENQGKDIMSTEKDGIKSRCKFDENYFPEFII